MDVSRLPESSARRVSAAAVAACLAIVLTAGAVYVYRLGDAPLYLGGDEAQFAVHAQSIAATGRDANGRLFPVFVNITDPLDPSAGSGIWYQPLLFYLMAVA